MSAAVENANEGSNPSSGKSQPMVVCSVCLEAVAEGAERSIAKLKCGHHFHLDCIGSAFNAKGRMQCPNCRQVEQGQWLYANGCFLHEDLVDDLTFEEDAEVFSAAGHLQFGHTPWCPHAGSYPHFSLTFEELDNLVNIYLDPSQNVTRGLRAPAAVGGLICPYLAAAQGLPSGGLSNHFQDFIALHVDRANRVMEDATHGLQTVSAATSAFSSLQPHARHLAVGFLVGSPQSAHAGFSHGTNFGGHPFLSQLPHGRNAQGSYGNVHPHPMNFSRNGHINVRRTRHGDILSTPQRTTQVSSLERAQMNEPVHDYCSWASPSVLGQIPNQVFRGDQIGWAAACSHIEPWTRGVYPPQISYETSSHSWAWVPPETNQGQRAMRNVALNTYHEGQVFGALRPTASLPGFSEQASEGAYAWCRTISPGLCRKFLAKLFASMFVDNVYIRFSSLGSSHAESWSCCAQLCGQGAKPFTPPRRGTYKFTAGMLLPPSTV